MTGKSLYLECYSGITGKMTVGALLDLGADQEVLKRALKSLTVPDFSYETEKVETFFNCFGLFIVFSIIRS